MIRKFYDVDCGGSWGGLDKHPFVLSETEVETSGIVSCECGTHLLKICCIKRNLEMSNDETVVTRQFDFAMFSYGEHTFKNKFGFFERLKIALMYLKTGSMFRDQLIMNEIEIKKLKKFIDENI